MEKERVSLLAQLLTSMKEATLRLEKALKQEDAEHVASIKQELLSLQAQIDKNL